MDPSKQESVSRQSSSILKPPKHRQPLQIVSAGPSSSESSPTVKIKRRVSFAKNKRIREFCNEAEQGTVWDDTYEEHDLSSSKSNSTGGTTNAVIINLPNDDKENFPIQLYMEPDELELQETKADMPNQFNDLLQSEIEMEITQNNYNLPLVQTENQEIEYPNATIYCDDRMDMTAELPLNIIPCQNILPNETIQKSSIINCDEMEMTAAIPADIVNNYQKHQKSLLIPQNIPIVDKENISDPKTFSVSIRTDNFQNKTQNITSILKKKTQYSNTTVYCDDGMEMTTAIPSKLLIGGNQNQSFYEDTLPVSRTNSCISIGESMPSIMQQLAEKLSSNDLSNRLIGEIPSSSSIQKYNKNQNSDATVYCNDGMEMTSAIPSNIMLSSSNRLLGEIPPSSSIQKYNKNQNSDATVYCNDGMEMTSAIPSSIMLLNTGEQKFMNENHATASVQRGRKNPYSNVTVYCDDGMEMTTAIPSNLEIGCTQNQSQYDDTLLVSQTSSVNTREFRPSIMQQLVQKLSSNNLSNQFINETQTFSGKNNRENQFPNTTVHCNDGMEMTAAVPSSILPIETKENFPKFSSVKNEILINNRDSQAISLNLNKENIPNHLDNFNSLPEENIRCPNVTVFCDDGMEITNAVKTVYSENNSQKLMNENQALLTLHNTKKNLYPETTVYYDDGMEMTSAIPSNLMLCRDKDKSFHDDTLLVSRTTSLKSKDNTPSIMQQINKKLSYDPIVNVNSKEVPAEVSCNYVVHKSNKRQLPDETIYCLDGMEMTNLIPSSITNRNNSENEPVAIKTRSDDIGDINYKSINLQEDADVSQKNKKMKYLDSTIICSEGMEMTAGIKTNIVCHKQGTSKESNPPVKISCILENADNLPSRFNRNSTQSENKIQTPETYKYSCSQNTLLDIEKKKSMKNFNSTIHCHDNMEITAAIPESIMHNQYQNSVPEITENEKQNQEIAGLQNTILCSNGMEITKVITANIVLCHDKNTSNKEQKIPTEQNKSAINEKNQSVVDISLTRKNENAKFQVQTRFNNELKASLSADILNCFNDDENSLGSSETTMILSENSRSAENKSTFLKNISEVYDSHKKALSTCNSNCLSKSTKFFDKITECDVHLKSNHLNLITENNHEPSNIVKASDKKTVMENGLSVDINYSSQQSVRQSLKDFNEITQKLERSANDSNVEKLVESENSPMKICNNLDENKTEENHLNKMRSDDTELLIATMGFKTDLAHPLIINEKTTIKILSDVTITKPFSVSGTLNELIPNKTYVIETEKGQDENKRKHSDINNSEKIDKNETQILNLPIPFVNCENNYEKTNAFELEKEDEESSVKIDLFTKNYSAELEEIEPPSFLCSDSIENTLKNESIKNLSIIDHEKKNLFLNESNVVGVKNNALVPSNKCEDISLEKLNEERIDTKEPHSHSSIASKENIIDSHEKVKEKKNQNLDCQLSPTEIKDKKKRKNKENLPFGSKLLRTDDSKSVNIDHEKVAIDEPLTPWQLLLKNIKIEEQRDNCIWSIHTMNLKLITISFISESLILYIKLNEPEKACNSDIDEIKIISRLHCDSKNTLMKVVHRLLLSKLNSSSMLHRFKLYEDVLPMLETVSDEVIIAMKFMFDLERLSTFNLFEIDEYRASFWVSSKNCNIILKISLPFKVFEDIGPDDINVKCVLGDIKTSDIQRLIKNIKKDYKYLSKYIDDIKEYVTMIENSTYYKNIQ